MSFTSETRTRPLFVNNSQKQKYGCSPHVSTAAVLDKCADQGNKACVKATKFDYKPDSVSPVFGRLQKSLCNGPNSLTDCDSMRTVEMDSAFTQCVHDNAGSKSLSSTKSEDSDRDSPVFNSRSLKRRRLHKRKLPVLIDSDDSDNHLSDFGGKAYKTSSSNYCVNNESQQNEVVAKRDQRLSALEDRNCFDLLLNYKNNNAVTNSDILQSLQSSCAEPLRRNDVCRNSTKSYSDESDWDEKDAINCVSSECSVCLHQLQLHDVPCRIVLSQEDKLLLAGRCSSSVSSNTSDNHFTASDDLIRLSEVAENRGSAMQSSDMRYCSSDDLFSDNELVESVCLSPSRCCNPDEQRDNVAHDLSKPSGKNPECAVTSKQPEVPFVSYSQDEDDCILIDDSDDELFANLTQNDMTLKDEAQESEDCDECGSADDDNWMQDDDVCVTAAASRNHVGEMPVSLEVCDPWTNDVADVSSDELEEAYNAAMSYTHPVEGDFAADTQQLYHSGDYDDDDDDDAVTGSNFKLLHYKTSPCSVSLKPLSINDIPPGIQLSQEQKHMCEPDVAVVHDETNDDFDSVMSSETVRTISVSYRINSDTAYPYVDEDEALLTCNETSAKVGIQADSDTVKSLKDAVFDERYQTSPRCGVFEKFNRPSSVEVVQSVDVKHRCDKRNTSARTALENCVEVADFYGTSLTRASKENRWHKRDPAVVKDMTELDKMADAKNSNGLHCPNKDQSHLKSQKLDAVKSGYDSADDEEEWKNKSSMQSFSNKTSSVQYQKIAQMRDCGKSKLRRDKTSLASGRRLQSDDYNDRFMGLSQFSVAKQQLVERSRQLKTNGLCCCCLSIAYV